MNFNSFDVLTFDCYGTLIDWEAGILRTLTPVLAAHGVRVAPDELLELYGKFEAEEEKGEYRTYKAIQSALMAKIGEHFQFTPTDGELTCLSDSIQHWLPFPDTIGALKVLHKRYKLAIISNVDDDLFVATEKRLHTKLDWVITAEQVQSYKPSRNNFLKAIERMGIPKERILHVAQSIFHDIVPAKELGLSTVWVNRRHSQGGFGATPPAHQRADVIVPDLRSLSRLTGMSA